MKALNILILMGCLLAGAARGMDRFAALAQIETGNTDAPATTDVSRFGISPPVWRQYTALPLTASTNPFTARAVAHQIMADRIALFKNEQVIRRINEALHAPGPMNPVNFVPREPTDAEWYLLWHRPATLLWVHRKTTPSELDRAARFANLVALLPRANALGGASTIPAHSGIQ